MDARLLLPVAAILGRGAELVGAWLLTYAVHSTVLIAAAWLLVARSHFRWSPAARHALWSGALVAGFITATLQLASPWAPIGGALQLPGVQRALAAVQVLQHGVAEPVMGAGGVHEASTRIVVVGISATSLAVAAWAVVVLALGARLLLAHRRLDRALAGRRAADGSLAAGALRYVCTLGGVHRAVSLSTSDALAAPAAIAGDEIVLPTRALRELSLAEQEGVLAHELAHVLRRDTLWLRLAAIIEAVAWFQPLNRIARRQMQLSAEFAADAWAVGVTREPLRLAKALARVAGWVAPGGASHAALAPGADGSPLVERVRRLTMPRRERDGLGGHMARGAMLAVAVLALALLPRIDIGAVAGKGIARAERFELEVARAGDPRAAPHQAAPTAVTMTRLVRLGTGDAPRLPASWLEASNDSARVPRRLVLLRRVAS